MSTIHVPDMVEYKTSLGDFGMISKLIIKLQFTVTCPVGLGFSSKLLILFYLNIIINHKNQITLDKGMI